MLDQSYYRKTDEIIEHYGKKAGSLIPIMQDIQAEYRYLPGELLTYVAEQIGITEAKAYSVATFYENFSFEAKGKYVIPVRLNARELRELEEQVEKSGLSREEFMRSLILGAQVHAKPCEHHPELLRKIAGLCNNANQLAHVANASGMASEQSVQEMLRLTKETWHLVKEEW